MEYFGLVSNARYRSIIGCEYYFVIEVAKKCLAGNFVEFIHFFYFF